MRTPDELDAELRPYQERGLAWLTFMNGLGLGALLADDMGLGKTISVLSLLVHERENGARPDPTLLILPMSLVGNWQREAARFTPSCASTSTTGRGGSAATTSSRPWRAPIWC